MYIYTSIYIHIYVSETEVATTLRLSFFVNAGFVHRPRFDLTLHSDKENVWPIRPENEILALGICFPQQCSSAGRILAASGLYFNYYQQIGSFPQNRFDEMLCKLNSIENLHSFKKYPTLP